MLNTQQQTIFDNVFRIYNRTRKEPTAIRITGEGGTGKTHTASHIIKALSDKWDVSILVITISHEALRNFSSAIAKVIPDLHTRKNITFKTIASALKQFPVGVSGFSAPNNENLNKYDIVFIDEYSNVGEKKTQCILNGLKSNALAIFSGDYAQLPPVMDRTSEVTLAQGNYARAYGYDLFCFELTQQMRQSGGIKQLSRRCRQEAYFPNSQSTVVKSDAALSVHKSVDALVNLAARYIKEYGIHNVCVYSYTNKEAQRIGKALRDTIYPKCPSIITGEELLVTKGNMTAKTGQIIKANITKITERFGITFYTHVDSHGVKYTLCHKKQQKKFKALLISLEKLANQSQGEQQEKYSKLLKFYSNALIVSYQYSKTIHSVQGVTTPYTFINSPDLKKCRAARKNLLYVGYSRASKELHLVEC